MSNREIEIAVEIVGETAKAYRVEHGGKEPVWVPKSQITDIGCGDDGKTITSIFIPEWLAIEKGMV